MAKKKIMLLSDDLRMPSGVGTVSKNFVLGTLDKYDWVQIGGAVKHPDEGKVIDITVPEKCNVIFYDADHDPLQQYKNINHLLQFCEDEFILLVDDANMPGVVESVEDLVKHKKLNVLFERKILTSIPEDQSSWWNGIYILLIQK